MHELLVRTTQIGSICKLCNIILTTTNYVKRNYRKIYGKLWIIGLVIFPNSLFSSSVRLFTLYMFPNSNTFEKMRNIPNELTSVARCSFVPGRRRLYPLFEVLHLQVMPFFQRRSFVQERVLQIRLWSEQLFLMSGQACQRLGIRISCHQILNSFFV